MRRMIVLMVLVSACAGQRAAADWPMCGANPQRTSWCSDEVAGRLVPLWYRPIEPYLQQKVQIVAVDDTLYLSTSAGLYAFQAETGAPKWVYATALPVGHSPTVAGKLAYVGCLDRRIHAVDIAAGRRAWVSPPAGAGFETNPLVIPAPGGKTLVIAGNRDGKLYCYDASGGALQWTFDPPETDEPIVLSCACDGKRVYFGAGPYAYAVDLAGKGIWTSAKLPGHGFRTYWPVVYKDRIIFSGASNYRNIGPGPSRLDQLDGYDIYPREIPRGTPVAPKGAEPGDWAAGTPTLDLCKSNEGTLPVTEYFEEPTAEEAGQDPAGLKRRDHKPWRRTYFVLDAATGKEVTYDFDGDGRREYAPIIYSGTHGVASRFPPVVGGDGVLYQYFGYLSAAEWPFGWIVGWKMDSPFLSVPARNKQAVDQPRACSSGGNVIYHLSLGGVNAGAFDVSRPGTEWEYWNEHIYLAQNADTTLAGYNVMMYPKRHGPSWVIYGPDGNGSCGNHGVQHPPIPHRGKVYVFFCNCLMAWGTGADKPQALPLAKIVAPAAGSDDLPPPPAREALKQRLAAEVKKILDAGPLKPGYLSSGIFDQMSDIGERVVDYWSSPADNLHVLLRALPHLPDGAYPGEASKTWKDKAGEYIRDLFNRNPPYSIRHVGWKNGAPRDVYDLPPEVVAAMEDSPPSRNGTPFRGWDLPPFVFYVMYEYARAFGDAPAILSRCGDRLPKPPADEMLLDFPHALNAFLSGYIGYLQLQKLARAPESPDVRQELDRLLKLRLGLDFGTPVQGEMRVGQKKWPWEHVLSRAYYRDLNASRQFMYMTPELAERVRKEVLDGVRKAWAGYNQAVPYWFVSAGDDNVREGALRPLHVYHDMFQARAQILKAPYAEMTRYLDAPVFAVGDMFYLDNLVSVLEAGND